TTADCPLSLHDASSDLVIGAHDGARGPVHATVVPPHEHLEHIDVTGANARDESTVGGDVGELGARWLGKRMFHPLLTPKSLEARSEEHTSELQSLRHLV